MTTVKEFKKQKQEILENVNLTVIVNTEGYLRQSRLIKLINELQLPRPTCSTCNHINLKCDSNTYDGFLCEKKTALNADVGMVSTSGGYNIRIKDIKNFGCNQHSDYEAQDE